MDLLRPRTSLPRDDHGEWIARKTVAVHAACDNGFPYVAVQSVGRFRRWRWYGVTPVWFEDVGMDAPVLTEDEGRAWTRRGARRLGLRSVDPLRPTQEALQAARYRGLSGRAARVARALDALVRVSYVACGAGLIASLVALLVGWSGAVTLVNVVLFTCAVPNVALRTALAVWRGSRNVHAEEVL